MGDDGLKDFTINWMVGGLLMFCLLAFSIAFIYNNNTSALDDGSGDIFSSSSSGLSGNLYEITEDSNTLLNITANTNPEVSDLGSRDSVAVSYEAKGEARGYWDSSKLLLSWVFSGTQGKILLGFIGGIIGFLSVFYIWRFIRSGN